MVLVMRLFLVLISLVAGWLPVAWATPAHAAGAPDSAILTEACYWMDHAGTGRDAAYVPGMDAYGREVIPADISPSIISAPEILEFDILVDLAGDLPPGSLPIRAYQTISHIALNTDTGEMWVNGELLGRHDGIDLEAGCAEASSEDQ